MMTHRVRFSYTSYDTAALGLIFRFGAIVTVECRRLLRRMSEAGRKLGEDVLNQALGRRTQHPEVYRDRLLFNRWHREGCPKYRNPGFPVR